MKTKVFDILERTARTFVQGFLAVATLSSLTAHDVNLLYSLEAGGLAGAYAVLSAFAIPPKGK